jgi:radical SAM superfamily enzyme YgiQ (UPF0313 family)
MKAQDLRDRARATLAREAGVIVKPHGQRLRIALAFPNTYHIGMSNLGFQTIYRLFNEMEDVVCERVFLPPRQELQDQRAAGLKLLTIESQTPVKDFDVFALSVSFEWDYPNVLTLLRLAGMPVLAADRQAGRDPLVVLGGAVTFVNPEPLALFADVIAAGEGEVLVPTLVQRIREATGRESLLAALGQDRGFYVPSAWTPDYAPDGTLRGMIGDPARGGVAPVKKAAVRTTDLLDPPHTQIFTPDTEFGSRFLIEVVRGCANLCRFCWAGYNYLPVRSFDTARILALAEKARAHANRVGLVSIALCDHPDIELILERMAGMGYSISPASLRLDDLNESIVRRLVTSGERGVTIAPEAGSDRLRRVINKTFTNEEILDKANLLFANGVENLKLYFMIGLPTETDEDLVAMRDLTAQLRGIMLHHGRTRGRVGRIVASVNPLIPKPGTAYQWLPMEDPAITDRKAKRLKKIVADLDNVYFTVKSERHSFYQALMSLGDRRVAPVIDMVERNGGNWREAVEATGVDADFFIFRDRSQDAYLPWDVIDGGMKQSFFRSEFDKSTRAEWTLPVKRQQENARLLPVIS